MTATVIDNLAYYDACLSPADVAALGIPELTVEDMFAILSGSGALSAQMLAVYRQVALLSGSGTLTASMLAAYQRLAALLGNGSLTAETFVQYARAMGLSGAGAFAALVWELEQAEITAGGVGTVSATVMARYTMTVPFSGGGTLRSPEFFDATYPDGLSARVARSYGAFLNGSGTLSALTRMYQIQSAAALTGGGALAAAVTKVQKDYVTASLSGGGALTATVFAIEQRPAPLSGTGTLSATVSQRYPITLGQPFTDDFNRADNLAQISNGWVPRNGVMGIYTNGVVPVTASLWNEVSAPTVMSNDDMEVSFTLGEYIGNPAAGDYTTIMFGCNAAGEGMFIFFNGGNGVTVYSQLLWDTAGLAVQATAVIPTQAAGDMFTARRTGNTYTILKNGVSVLDWPDTGNIIPRDASHRFVGLAGYTDGTNARRMDNFVAGDASMLYGGGTLTASIRSYVPVPRTAAFSGGGTVSATAQIPAMAEVTTQFTTVGAYSYTIPWWANYVDEIFLGAGGGGAGGSGATAATGNGALAGTYNSRTLVRGGNLPRTTTQLTGNIGDGGNPGAQNNGGVAGSPVTRNAISGGDIARQGDGGGGGGGTGGDPGRAAGNLDFNGKTYVGGAQVNSGGNPGAAGNPPGGGGGGGAGGIFNTGKAGGKGGRGQAWFRAYQ